MHVVKNNEVLKGDPNTRENIGTPLISLHKSVSGLREDIQRIRNLSNQLYISVSSFQLPPEEAIYWG